MWEGNYIRILSAIRNSMKQSTVCAATVSFRNRPEVHLELPRPETDSQSSYRACLYVATFHRRPTIRSNLGGRRGVSWGLIGIRPQPITKTSLGLGIAAAPSQRLPVDACIFRKTMVSENQTENSHADLVMQTKPNSPARRDHSVSRRTVLRIFIDKKFGLLTKPIF